MDNTLDWLIIFFRTYGIPVLGCTIVLQCGGVPTGANFLVIAAGAFAYAGEFNVLSLIGWVWFFNIVGDSFVYWVWRRYGLSLLEKLASSRRFLDASLKKSAHYLDKYGQSGLVITRFPLSGLGPPMNILTGLTDYGYSRFLLAIIPGEFLWTGFNLGMGFWFGDQWETVGHIVNQYLLWIVLLAALLWVLYMLIRQTSRYYRLVRLKNKGLSMRQPPDNPV